MRPRAVSSVCSSLSTSLSPWCSLRREGRTDGAREREPSVVVERRLAYGSDEDGISRVRASESACERAREEARAKRAMRRPRGTGCRRLHGNEARRECDGNHGSRGFLSRADLSVPLSGLSSSSFSSSGPLPSAHEASEPRTPLLSRADPLKKGGAGSRARRKGFSLFLPFHLSFRAASRESFFPCIESIRRASNEKVGRARDAKFRAAVSPRPMANVKFTLPVEREGTMGRFVVPSSARNNFPFTERQKRAQSRGNGEFAVFSASLPCASSLSLLTMFLTINCLGVLGARAARASSSRAFERGRARS